MGLKNKEVKLPDAFLNDHTGCLCGEKQDGKKAGRPTRTHYSTGERPWET